MHFHASACHVLDEMLLLAVSGFGPQQLAVLCVAPTSSTKVHKHHGTSAQLKGSTREPDTAGMLGRAFHASDKKPHTCGYGHAMDLLKVSSLPALGSAQVVVLLALLAPHPGP